MLMLTNTKTRTKEVVEHSDQAIKLYTCGPTVYAYAHIGNFRTFVAEDLLRRTLQFLGYRVEQVMNLTDVDDKTIRGALAKGVTLDAYTKEYKDAFFEDLQSLHIESAEQYPEATRYIPQMIEMIETLLKKGKAYIGQDQSVYFKIASFPQYGALSHLKCDDLQAGASARVAVDEYAKDHVCDFVLWKAYDSTRDGEVFWDSPFGKGRPGWHIECSVMAHALLGQTVDIHVGGVDLVFPHHENEIAQSEACFEMQFCKLWMHVEHLLVNHQKMSKSLGNYYTLRDLLNLGYTGKEIRYMLLATHYRSQLNFTMHSLEQSRAALCRIQDFLARLRNITGSSDVHPDVETLVAKSLQRFRQAIADDLQISEALAAVFDCIREGNSLLDSTILDKSDADKIISLFRVFDTVLGIMTFEEEKIPEEISRLIEERNLARVQKNWTLSDTIRQRISDLGYVVEDTESGVRVKKSL